MQSSGLLFVDPQNILLYGQSIPPAFLAIVAAWLSPALSLPSVQLSSGLFANTLIDISINRNTQMWMCRPVFMTTYRNTHMRDLYLRLPWQCRFGVLAAHPSGRKGAVEGVAVSTSSTLQFEVPKISASCTVHCMPAQRRSTVQYTYVCISGFIRPITDK